MDNVVIYLIVCTVFYQILSGILHPDVLTESAQREPYIAVLSLRAMRTGSQVY